MTTLAHILYGTAALTHGNLTIAAKPAGRRGEQIAFSITTGSPLAVNVSLKGDGTGKAEIGSIVVVAPADTTEQQLYAALNASSNFRKLAGATLVGDGDAVIATLAAQNLIAAGGLRQALQARLGVDWWEDRDQKSTASPVGFIYPHSVKQESVSPPFEDEFNTYSGVVVVSLSFQGVGFEAQNASLDQMRRALEYTIRTFTAEGLYSKGNIEFSYSNALKEERANSKIDEADLRIEAKIPLRWAEPAADDDATFPTLESINPGLWLEPLTDSLGAGGGEVLDTQLSIEE